MYGSLYLAKQPDFKDAGYGKPTDQFMDPRAYVLAIPKLFKEVRKACGDDIELLHDTHERVQPLDMLNMCKRIEEFDPQIAQISADQMHLKLLKSARFVDLSSCVLCDFLCALCVLCG